MAESHIGYTLSGLHYLSFLWFYGTVEQKSIPLSWEPPNYRVSGALQYTTECTCSKCSNGLRKSCALCVLCNVTLLNLSLGYLRQS
jgi:hypothetical protein